MKNLYDQKSFIVLIRRNSKSKTPVYYYKFEGFDSHQEQNETNYGLNWKESIVSSLFINSSYKEDLGLLNNETDTFAIRLIIHSAKDILVGQSYSSANVPTFAQYFLKEQTKQIQNDLGEKSARHANTLIPIIHITLSNLYIYNMYGDNVELPTFVPRSYQIMDSSIWNYLVPINGIPQTRKRKEVTVDERFLEVIDSIYNNYKKGLYSLSVAHEYADINARLSEQSFLSGAHASGVAPFIFHSESAIKRMIDDEFYEHFVTDDNRCEGRNTIDNIRERRWRILLIDDKAISPMDTTECSRENQEYFSWNCKLTIIRDILEKKFGLKGKIHCKACNGNVSDATLSFNIKKDITIDINKIQKGLNEIKDSIIKKSIGKDVDSEEKDRIIQKGRKDILCNILPMGEPIEGYKLYFNNKAITTDYWNEVYHYLLSTLPKEVEVIEGCPSCTQILIEYAQNISEAEVALKEKKYDLILLDYLLNGSKGKEYGYKLLDDIYNALKDYKDDYTLNKDSYKIGPSERLFFIFISAYSSAVYERLLAEGLNRSEKYWHIAVGACPTNTPQLFLYNLIKLMEKRLDDSGIERLSAKGIFKVVNDIYGDYNGVRYKANKLYQNVLDMHYLYKKMLKDVHIPSDGNIFNTAGSVLITDFITKNVNLGGLLEHLTQLVHITAFGTVRQWPEMWEEYTYFKSQFQIQFFEGNKENRDKLNNLCIAIENYILDLKKEMR